MNDHTLAHPSADELTRFLSGLLDQAQSGTIEEHLGHCDTCRSVLEVLPDDSLSGALRASADLVNTLAPGQAAPVKAAAAGASPLPATVPAELANHSRYIVRELLGAGGMGAVFKAEHRLMKRLVALKVINPELMVKPAAVERFNREVEAAARLAHPNIVTAYDAEQAGNTHFLVMEYVEGTSLDRVVARQGPLPVAAACEHVRQAALGLQQAFERGMVHRDIKPQNLMLTPDGQVKILDFGLARFVSESGPAASGPVTHSGVVMGTPDYIAPEQANDAHGADIRADIYSLGCTLYFLLTGQTPFPGGTYLEKLMGHLERTPEPASRLRSNLPPKLAAVIERMMAKRPGDRYRTPAEVARALAPFAGTDGAECA